MNGSGDPGVMTPPDIRWVLLPLDGSDFALAALPTARALCARFSAGLRTISAASDERDAEHLRRHVEALGDDAGVDVVIASDPAAVIAGRVDELAGSVVCMSTRGRGRTAGSVIGSVTRSLLQSSTAPMVVVGPQADRPGALVGRPRRRPQTWPEPLSAGGIVACVDGSTPSEAVLPVAAAWAAALDVSLTVLSVAEASATEPGGGRPNRFGPADPQRYVDELADRWRHTVPSITGVVTYEPIGVAAGVRSYLDSHPTGLVALTAHGRTGLDRLRLGATAADIVRTSSEPALVVPIPHEERPPRLAPGR